MAQTTALKRRITSVKNTKQITKAMELVAASKMRRAQEAALRSRDFNILASQILTRLRQLTDISAHSLFAKRKVKTRLLILITSDRGLAGAYNSNLFKLFAKELTEDKKNNIATKIIVIGNKGSRMIARLKGLEVIAAYSNFPEHPTANDIRPILDTVTELFTPPKADEDDEEQPTAAIDAVDIIYTEYISSINQVAQLVRLLPVAFEEVELDSQLGSAEFEPSPEVVLHNVTERLVEAQLHQAFLEALASEHSMRMLAMKNATDNATDLIDDLTLAFNTARQAAITQELAEITGGAEAISA